MKFFNLFNFESPKARKRRILKENIERGRAGERQAVFNDAVWGGWISKRTGRGSDFKQERVNIFNGRTEKRRIEVKTGNARKSPLQRKSRAILRRINPWPPY